LLTATVPWKIFGKQFYAGVKLGVDGSDISSVRRYAGLFDEHGPDKFAEHMESLGFKDQNWAKILFRGIRKEVHRLSAELGNQALAAEGIPEEFFPGYNQPVRPENHYDLVLLADSKDFKKASAVYNNADSGTRLEVALRSPDENLEKVVETGKCEVVAPTILGYMDFLLRDGENIPDDPAGGLEKARETVRAYMDTRKIFVDNLQSRIEFLT